MIACSWHAPLRDPALEVMVTSDVSLIVHPMTMAINLSARLAGCAADDATHAERHRRPVAHRGDRAPRRARCHRAGGRRVHIARAPAYRQPGRRRQVGGDVRAARLARAPNRRGRARGLQVRCPLSTPRPTGCGAALPPPAVCVATTNTRSSQSLHTVMYRYIPSPPRTPGPHTIECRARSEWRQAAQWEATEPLEVAGFQGDAVWLRTKGELKAVTPEGGEFRVAL